MKRLNGMDAMLLYSETPNLHTHTLQVAIVDAGGLDDFGFEAFEQTMQRRLHLLDPLRYRLVDIPWRLHHPMWLENCEVDLDYHLRRVRVPTPGGRRELDSVISEIAGTPLDRSRPLWEFYFAEGMPGRRFALIAKVHHTLADGVASANLLARLLDLTPGDERDGYRVCTAPSTSELLCAAGRDHLMQVAALPKLMANAVRDISRARRRSKDQRDKPGATGLGRPQTFLNHMVSPNRTFATAAVAFDDVEETATRLDVTFDDVVLAIATGGLRELLLRYDGRADRPLQASVPVNTDRSPDRITGNEISGVSVSLPVHVDDPLERMRLISLETGIAGEDHDWFGPKLTGRVMEYLPPPLAPAAFRWQSRRVAHNRLANVAVSNVAGPRQHGNIAGAPVTEIYSVGALSAGSALNITVWRYADQVDISVLSDDGTFDDVHEATDAFLHGLRETRRAAGLTAELRTVRAALAPAHAGGTH